MNTHNPFLDRYNAFLDNPHLRATIRLALRLHGFTATRTAVDQIAEQRHRVGCWLRDQALPQRFPPFATADDYRSIAKADPLLWDNLPHMAGFGYQQAVLLHGLAVPSSEVDASAATLGAAFSAGIALVDYLVDEHAEGALVFEALSPNVVRRMFELAADTEATLAGAYERAEDPRLRLLCALVATCAGGFRELYRRSGNEEAWAKLAQVIARLYEAERTVSVVRPASRAELCDLLPSIEAKSVLPFVAMRHIVALAAPQPQVTEVSACTELASATLGRIIFLTDDLVDLPDDCHHGAPNVVILRLADKLAERGYAWPSDADVYEVVEATAGEIFGLLQPSAFGLAEVCASVDMDGSDANSRVMEPDAANGNRAALLEFARLTVARWVGWQEEFREAAPSKYLNRSGRMIQSTPTVAATEMLLSQQRAGYREAVHHLLLPRLGPDGLRLETHPALLFQRAIVLDGLLDAHAAGHPVPRSVIDAEAFAILRAKHREARGGWNYIPEVPELPPDADDLGMVLQVLYRVGGPALASTCDEAVRLALAATEPERGFPTWILDPDGRSAIDEAMRTYIEVTESGGVHPEVVSNLLYGIILYNPGRYHEDLLGAATYLEAAQDERGAWFSRWYAGPYYGTYRVVSALRFVAPESEALERARAFLLHSQRSDGSWGEGWSDPLATALAILALTAFGMRLADTAIEHGVTYLVGTQEADGGWPSSPFISFPRSDGVGMHTYASRTITTTFCLKALLAAAAAVGEESPIKSDLLSKAAWPTRPVSPEPGASGWN